MPIASTSRDEITFDAASVSLRGRKSRRLGAIALADQPMPVAPNDDTAQRLAEGIARRGIERLPWSKALKQWRDRVMFLRASEGDEWPDLSDAALAQERARLARAGTRGQDRACRVLRRTNCRQRSCTRSCRGRSSAGSMPRRRLISKRRPARRCRSITRRKADRKSRSGCRNCSASTAIRQSPAAKFRF